MALVKVVTATITTCEVQALFFNKKSKFGLLTSLLLMAFVESPIWNEK